MACANGSIERAKSVGLIRPCRHPLLKYTVLDKLPFILILAVGEWYKDLRHLITCLLKAKCLRTECKYFQRTESKALTALRLHLQILHHCVLLYIVTKVESMSNFVQSLPVINKTHLVCVSEFRDCVF